MPKLNMTHEGEDSDIDIRNAASSHGLALDREYEGGMPGGPDFVFSDGRGLGTWQRQRS